MNLWEVFQKMVYLTEEMDRKSLRKAKERNVEDREMDRLMADYLELKHRLENIYLD